ncbi:hypothetical protein F383_08404 [Gossypium arboreum]|uniref:Uncharacterized protein n=1 Tax=Gossypium arboreum TaxID=29729 RepID=A0A0B0NA20_GOSAR|nr:hypothetical protein F383_08404 [Gossypium arboreum]
MCLSTTSLSEKQRHFVSKVSLPSKMYFGGAIKLSLT